jgi:prepilin-type N-terminal cleavage/methylation domain-containing protein
MRRFNRGFTLIEIMIVIAIIGIIITIAAPSYTEYLNKGRRAEVVSAFGTGADPRALLHQKQRLHRHHRSEHRQRFLHHHPDDRRPDIPADRHPQGRYDHGDRQVRGFHPDQHRRQKHEQRYHRADHQGLLGPLR